MTVTWNVEFGDSKYRATFDDKKEPVQNTIQNHPRAGRLDPQTAARSLASLVWIGKTGRETPLRQIAQPHLENIYRWIPRRLAELQDDTRFDRQEILLCQSPRIVMPRHEVLTKLGLESMPATDEAKHWTVWKELIDQEMEYRKNVESTIEVFRCAADSVPTDFQFMLDDIRQTINYRVGLAGLRCDAQHSAVALADAWANHVAFEYSLTWDDLDEVTIYLEAARRLEV